MTMVSPIQKPQAAPLQKEAGQAAQFVSEGGGGAYALSGAAAGPGGAAQRNLQAMADASLRAAQLKSMQAKINQPVAQLAPIVNPNKGVAQLDELDSPLNHANADYVKGSTDANTKNAYSSTPTGKFSDQSSADKRAEVDKRKAEDAKNGISAPHQPVADLGELYAHSSMLKPEYDNQVQSIADSTNGKTKFRSGEGMKQLGRTMEKIAVDYGGDASRIVDLTGGSIFYDEIDDLIKGFHAVEANPFFNVVRVKNTLQNASGYGDINLALEMGSADFEIEENGVKKKEHYAGFIIELQLNLTTIIEQKEVGHKQYEEQRAISAKFPGTERKDWVAGQNGVTQQDIDDFDRLDKEMHDIYAKGWKKLISWSDFLNPTVTDKLASVRKKLSVIQPRG